MDAIINQGNKISIKLRLQVDSTLLYEMFTFDGFGQSQIETSQKKSDTKQKHVENICALNIFLLS